MIIKKFDLELGHGNKWPSSWGLVGSGKILLICYSSLFFILLADISRLQNGTVSIDLHVIQI